VSARRNCLVALVLCGLALPLASFAQQKAKVQRVAWLKTGPTGSDKEFTDDVKSALRELGFVEGRNVVYDERYADSHPERLPALAAELVALHPDVIVSGASAGTLAAKQATATIPIVMLGVADPVGLGFAASLAHPGGNITGISNMGFDMAAKPLEMLHAIAPRATRVAVLAPDNPVMARMLSQIVEASQSRGLTILPKTVKSAPDIESAFVSMVKDKAEGLMVIADTVTMINRKRVADLAAETRLPAVYQYATQVEAGGLLSYGPNPRNLHKDAAAYIAKILKGARPADLAVQQPTEFELAINMKTAKALGVTFPPEILLRADTVIE
jgi:putative tryptophan/tyrosine transport system substrate-binding protein